MQGSRELIQGLGEIDPKKPYGTELFNALARLTVGVAIEAVCIRFRCEFVSKLDQWHNPKPEFEVYITQRSPTDTAYPNEWHCPGSFIRPGEEISDIFKRLAEREFGGKIFSYRFVAHVSLPREARGHAISLVYLCTIEESDNLRGKWFQVNNLPEKTVEHHRYRIIPAAVGAFVAENTKICW